MGAFAFEVHCGALPTTTVDNRLAVGTTGDQGYVKRREVRAQPVRVVRQMWADVDGSIAEIVNQYWQESYYGVLPMTFSPPNGDADFDVAFSEKPLQVRFRNAVTRVVSVELTEVL